MKQLSKYIIIIFFTIALLMAALFGCKPLDKDTRPIVAVSIVPQATFVKKVAGDKVQILTLIPPGFSPESYELTSKQAITFSKSQIYFSIGTPAEVAITAAEHTKEVKLHQKVSNVHADLMQGSERDPHIWLSPKRAIVMVNAIAYELALFDNENKDYYLENAASFVAELEELDREINSSLQTVTNRKFLVFHPAFGYFASDYNLEMYALEQEGKEANLTHMTTIINLAKEHSIKIIFYQAETDGTQAKAFARELGGSAVMLSPLSDDYVNNLKIMAQKIKEAMS